MATRMIQLYLDDDSVAFIDEMAEKFQTSRSNLITQMLQIDTLMFTSKEYFRVNQSKFSAKKNGPRTSADLIKELRKKGVAVGEQPTTSWTPPRSSYVPNIDISSLRGPSKPQENSNQEAPSTAVDVIPDRKPVPAPIPDEEEPEEFIEVDHAEFIALMTVKGVVESPYFQHLIWFIKTNHSGNALDQVKLGQTARERKVIDDDGIQMKEKYHTLFRELDRYTYISLIGENVVVNDKLVELAKDFFPEVE